MKTIFTFLISLFIFKVSTAQDTFQKMIFSDSLPVNSYATPFYSTINPTKDGGFIFSGIDGAMGKFTYNGNLEWMRIVTGITKETTSFQLQDGSYISCGSSNTLVKTNQYGEIIWSKNYRNQASSFDDFGEIIRGKDGHAYLLTNSQSGIGIGITKIDSETGNILQDRHYIEPFGKHEFYGTNFYQTSDNGFIICGANYLYGADGLNVYLIKLDSTFNTQWSKIIYKRYNSPYYIFFPNAVIESLDGGYIITGYSEKQYALHSRKGDVIKVDSLGNSVWHKQYGNDSVNNFKSITKNSDSTFTLVGSTGNCDDRTCHTGAVIMKITANGSVIWSKISRKTNDLYSVIKSNSKTFTVSGITKSFGQNKGAYHMIRFTNNGKTCADFKNAIFTIAEISDSITNNVLAVRDSGTQMLVTNIAGLKSNIITPTVQSTCQAVSQKDFSIDNGALSKENGFNAVLYPNPVVGKIVQLKINALIPQKIKMIIMNEEGKIIIQNSAIANAGKSSIQLDVSKLSSGVYFFKLQGMKDQKVIQFIKAE